MTAESLSRSSFPRLEFDAFDHGRFALLTALAYCLSGLPSLAFAIPPGYATLIWPPAGVALAAAIWGGRRAWLGVFLGSFLINLRGHIEGETFVAFARSAALACDLATVIAAGAVAQAALGARLVLRWQAYPAPSPTSLSVAKLCLAGGFLACLVSPTVSTLLRVAFGAVDPASAPGVWLVGWGGDVLGVVSIAPALLGFAMAPPGRRCRRAGLAAAASLLVLAATGAMALAQLGARAQTSPHHLLMAALPVAALAVASFLVVTDRRYGFAEDRVKDLENQKFALDQHAIVSITNAAGIITYANDRFCAVSGYPRERLIGGKHDIIGSGRHSKAFYRDLWSVLQSGQVWRGEFCNRNAGGDLYWVDATLVPLKDSDGRAREFIAIGAEITARKRLEQDLESSRAFLRSVADSMGEGIFTIDGNGYCTFLNAEAERLLGWSFEELRDKRMHDFVHFQDQYGEPISAGDCAINRGLVDRGKYNSEDQCFTDRSGRIFPVCIVAKDIVQKDERIGAVIVFQDITERRRVHDRLVRSEQRLSIALSASSTGLWDWNLITGQAHYSDTWFRMLGWEPRPSPCSADVFFALIHPDDRADYDSALEEHLRNRSEAVDCQFRMRRADGQWAWIRSAGKLIEVDEDDGRPRRIVGVHIDTTASHAAQAELASAKDQAIRANQAKGDFLATMSHEIRTPMNAIIGLSHLLDRTALSARQRDFLNKIRDASQSLLAIVNDILDFSKIEAGKLTIEDVEFDLRAVVDNVLAMINPKISEKGLNLVVARAPELPERFIGDPLRLSQVLMNLLSNAAKFTSHGDIRLELQARPLQDDRCQLVAAISDTGIGMTEEQMASLFRPFTQADASTSRRFGGTGLGLAICRQLLNLMGGDISVRSVEGKGTTFTFRAPLRLAAPAGLAELETAEPKGKPALATDDSRPMRRMLRDVRILLVEDNPINQQVAKGLSDVLGVETTVASSGEEALEILATRQFDAILMDMLMPGKDGLQTTVAIRTQLGITETPIIAMTANAMAGDRERCLDSGMNDHLTKPIDPDRLALTLAQWLAPPGGQAARPVQPLAGATAREAAGSETPRGLNMNAARSHLGDNEELLLQLLAMFAAEHAGDADDVEAAIEANERRRVCAICHKLKSAASTLGAEKVAEVAASIEAATRPEAEDLPLAALRPKAAMLRAALAEAIGSMNGVLRMAANPPAAGGSARPPDRDSALAAIDALSKLLSNGDADAEPEAARLASLFARAARSARTKASAIAAHASRYDFDEARSMLDKLREEISEWS